MRVLVTGGAGFIGSHIVEELLARGHQPFVIDNLSTGFRTNVPDGVPFFNVDVRDKLALADAFDRISPDWVCAQAAQMSVSQSMRDPLFDAEVNVFGLLNVLENSSRVGVKQIVFASSGGVLYGEVTSPADEDHSLNPLSAYGLSKWTGEQYLRFYARERNIPAVALRYSNVFGPRQNPHGEAGVVAIFCQRMLQGQPITINGDGKYIRDYVFVQDVARANVLALESTPSSEFTPYNIGTSRTVDVNEIAHLLKLEVEHFWVTIGRAEKVRPFQNGPARSGDLRSNVISHAKATRELDWHPTVSLEAGLRPTVEWFSKNVNHT